MGLDMYLYKFSKPRKTIAELNKYSADELRDRGYFVFFKDAEELPANFDAIKPLAFEVNVDADYINFKKIYEDFYIPEDARVIGESYSSEQIGYTFEFPSTHEHKHVDIPTDEFEAKYVFTQKSEAFCLEGEQVGYWRKHYDLENAFYEACETAIENCGYYPFNDKMWDVLEKFDEKQYANVADYRDDPDCLICYHEWY